VLSSGFSPALDAIEASSSIMLQNSRTSGRGLRGRGEANLRGISGPTTKQIWGSPPFSPEVIACFGAFCSEEGGKYYPQYLDPNLEITDTLQLSKAASRCQF